MSNKRNLKRKSDYSSTEMNELSKRFKDNNNNAHRINPNTHFGQNNNTNKKSKKKSYKDLFNDDNETFNNNKNDTSSNDNELDNLLYNLSRLDVDNHENEERCPICSKSISTNKFASHVYNCLDGIGQEKRNDIGSQIEEDENLAKALTSSFGGRSAMCQPDTKRKCPICNKILFLGDGMNVHVNQCLDNSSKDDKMMDDKINSNIINIPNKINNISNNNNKNKVKKLTTSQLAAVAKHVLNEQKGSKEYNDMLSMFSCLGFKKQNMSKAVEEHKKNNNCSSNNNNIIQTSNNNNNNNWSWDDDNIEMSNNNKINNDKNTDNNDKNNKNKRPDSPDLMLANKKLKETKVSQSPPPRCDSAPIQKNLNKSKSNEVNVDQFDIDLDDL